MSAVADVFEGEVDYGEEGGHGGGEAFYSLDVAFMAFDAVFEGGQAAWLTRPEERGHLALQCGEVGYYLCFEIAHGFLFLISAVRRSSIVSLWSIGLIFATLPKC